MKRKTKKRRATFWGETQIVRAQVIKRRNGIRAGLSIFVRKRSYSIFKNDSVNQEDDKRDSEEF